MTSAQPSLFWYVLGFVLVVGPLIFVHELGHYLVGRACGVKADVFSIGFGSELFGWTDRRGTRWKVCLLPLGGYVKFAGDMNPAGQPSDEWLMLPAEDDSMDVAVASLVLCSVPDQGRALAEIRRVLRPDGELRFYEHVVADSPGFARIQRLAQPVWTMVGGGCHPDRDTAAAIEASGFEIETIRHFHFSASLIDRLCAPQIVGVARKR